MSLLVFDERTQRRGVRGELSWSLTTKASIERSFERNYFDAGFRSSSPGTTASDIGAPPSTS